MDKDLIEALRAIPKEMLLEIYNDGPKGPLKQMGALGESILKTLRYITYPLQVAAHRQDLIDRRFAEALKTVPESRRIAPSDSLALEVADKLRFQVHDNLISDMYIDLLSASMDSQRVNLAHPSFIHIIGQLSSDEAFLLLRLSENECSPYVRRMADWGVVSENERETHFSSARFPINNVETSLTEIFLKPEDMHFPQNFYMYIDHLRSLELIEYCGNDIEVPDEWRQTRSSAYAFWFISLSKFGKLFFECCSKGLQKLD